MFTVFIADDESKVISGLIHRVNWKKVDACVIGYADNGKEARDRILELRPDIVITDIYMPGMTGIELINELSDVVDTVFIIFSAYSEFEYAREAIHLNVADYLIKPVNICEIESTLERAQNQVQEKRRSSVIRNEEYTLMKLMDGEVINPDEMVLEQGAAIMAVILGFPEAGEEIEKARKAAISWRLINGKIYTIQRGKKLLIAGVQKQYDMKGSLRKWMLMRVRELSEELSFYWGMGCMVEQWEEINKSIYSAEEMLDYSEFYQEQVEEPNKIEKEKSFQDKFMDFADELILNLDEPMSERKICGQIRELLKETFRDAEEVKVSMIEFVYCLRSKFEETYKKKTYQWESDWKMDVVYKLLKSETLDNMFEILYTVILQFRSLLSEENETTAQGIVGKVQKYIRRHLKEDISLNDIARYIDRNPTYISHVFRAATGETLFEYITRLRMERAMELLRNSTMKIQEVAAAVGYDEQSYFSQVFKKYTGQTAGEYRKLPH